MSLIPFFTVLLMFMVYQLQNKLRFGVVSLLFLTYIGMFLASFLLKLSGLFYSVFPLSFSAMIYFALCLATMFMGFMSFRDHRLMAIRIENIFVYRTMEVFLIIGGFSAILFFLPFAYRVLSTEDIKMARILFDAEMQAKTLGRFGLLNSILSLFANLFIVAMICSFINLVPIKGKRRIKRAILLMVSSLSYVVYVLAYVGRDGVVYWIMTFIYCFLLFRPGFISIKDRKRFKRLALIFSIIILIPFFLITIGRFRESEGGVVWSIVSYCGQQVNNLNDQFIVNPPVTYGRTSFPVFATFFEFIGVPIPEANDVDYYLSTYGVRSNVFGTYISSFLKNFGKLGTYIFILLLSILTRGTIIKLRRKRYIYFSNFLVFTLIYQIFYWGVFYFRQYSTNYYILFMLLLSIFFKLSKYKYYSIFIIKKFLK